MLRQCLTAAGGLTGERQPELQIPEPFYSRVPQPCDSEPRRDERFIDPFSAGVNPEAFLYDERFSARDKTLMMYYKRIRELDVPEMMASILKELRNE